MSTVSCFLSFLSLIVCIRSSTSAVDSMLPLPEVTADREPASTEEQRVFDDGAAVAAIGSAGQSIDWRGSAKNVGETGTRQRLLPKRTPITEVSGYACCRGDIYCVRGRCASVSSLLDGSWMEKRSQWREQALGHRLRLESL